MSKYNNFTLGSLKIGKIKKQNNNKTHIKMMKVKYGSLHHKFYVRDSLWDN